LLGEVNALELRSGSRNHTHTKEQILPVDPPTITNGFPNFCRLTLKEKKYSEPITTRAISAQPLNPFNRAAKFGYIA
jgi:hypothetical protein